MNVGMLIRSTRKAKNLTQKQLGELSGIAEPTIRRYELGKLNPKYETLQRIAVALGVPIWQLLPAANQEPDRDYERVCDALDAADLCLEAVGVSDGSGPDGDRYCVWHKDAESPEEDREEYSFRELLEVVERVSRDAEMRKRDYFRKRLDAELF